jgi:hypothetical protein
VDLTGQPDVVWQFSFHRQAITLEFAHFARISGEDFDSARRTASIAAAAMEDVNPGILKNEY